MAVAANTIFKLWTIRDASSDPLTGQTTPTDVTFTLHRTTATGGVASTETVGLTEIGSTGHYVIDFTPDNVGVYTLQLKELNVSSLQRTVQFDFEVHTAGTVFTPSYANAYCAEADLERWIQQTISSTTSPDATEASGFAESRAAVLSSFSASKGFAVTPGTVTSGSRLQDLLREANAIGASLDFTIAQSFREGPARTERIPELLGLWHQYLGDPARPEVAGFLEMEISGNLSSLSTDHVVSGDTQAAPTEVVTAEPIQTRMSDVY